MKHYKYYMSEDRLVLARTEDDVFFSRYSWIGGTWVSAQHLYADIVLCHDWYDEATEEEINDAIANRTEPIYSYRSS